MRKITQNSINAFLFSEFRPYREGNTKVESVGYTRILKLHGNDIAHRQEGTNKINITLAGWNTNTTRERLNGLPGVHVTTKQGQAYLNGEKWDGSWTTTTL